MQRKQIIYSILLALLCAAAPVFTMADEQHFYVEEGGVDDEGRDGSETQAWRTITYALGRTEGSSSEPVVIHVADGMYEASAGEEFPICPDNYDTIQGTSWEHTNVRGEHGTPVFRFEGVNASVKIDLLNISLGSYEDGGGIYCLNASPEISNCKVLGNWATGAQSGEVPKGAGAGLYCRNSSPYVHDCQFYNNRVVTDGWGGGAIFCGWNSNAVIESCHIWNNYARRGGGIACYQSSPTIRNCKGENRIENNEAFEHGGGVYLSFSSSPRIEDCNIYSNTAEESYGGLACVHQCSPYVVNTTISYNCLGATSTGRYGAGVRLDDGSNPLFIRCSISHNYTARYGGGVYVNSGCKPRFYHCTINSNTGVAYNGGGMYCYGALDVIMQDCTFDSNEAPYGAGICLWEETNALIRRCTISNNTAASAAGGLLCGHSITEATRIEHCVFYNNEGTAYGAGAMRCQDSASPKILNCLFLGNKRGATGVGGAISCVRYSDPWIVNCTIVGDPDDPPDGEGVYAMYDNGEVTSLPTLTNCIIWHNKHDDIVNIDCSQISHCDIEDDVCSGDPDVNLHQDPKFVDDPDKEYGEYHLSMNGVDGQTEDSPCRDAGDRNSNHEDLGLHIYTTRTDDEYDDGTVDLGYHYKGEKDFYYVDDDGDNGYDGRSPETAWQTIYYALEHIPPGSADAPITIRVAEGTYNTGLGEVFPLTPQSDYISIIGEGSGKSIVDAGEDNNPVFKIGDTGDPRSHITVKGFTVTGAHNYEGFNATGGGFWLVESSNITIEACDIHDNLSRVGGGAFFKDVTDSLVTATSIRGNTARYSLGSGTSGEGGGINFRASNSGVTIEFCQITGNAADTRGGGIALREGTASEHMTVTINGSTLNGNHAVDGGALWAHQYCDVALLNNQVTYNTADTNGGGLYYEIECLGSIRETRIQGNEATSGNGGGICCMADCQLYLPSFVSVFDNTAGGSGGGIYCDDSWNASPSDHPIKNCLIAKNTASAGGGICCSSGSTPEILNCTIEGNSPSGVSADGTSFPTLKNSIIWNNAGDDLDGVDCSNVSYCDIEEEYECDGRPGVFYLDPIFVPVDEELNYIQDPSGYYLAHEGPQAAQSPCVDYGDDTAENYMLHIWTTRTDNGHKDEGMVDLGVHHRGAYDGDYYTYIELASFEAAARGNSILITWETATEINNAGFDLYRLEHGDRTTRVKINDRLIPTQGSPAVGASYEFLDTDVRPGVTYDYYLVDIDTSGNETTHGPAYARIQQRPTIAPDDRTSPYIEQSPLRLRPMLGLLGLLPVF